ncbi:MarR family transcriptional regulator BagL/FevM [Streptomyces sp. NPDC052101]|uniref:MarR family transcriptional regulator BagL/FevM n=1 Tax=Streptomyces sp. NPDC052101 TaxID=3155763 RepID=UPI00342CB236
MTNANPRNWLQLDESLPHQLRRATQAWTLSWQQRVPDLTTPQFAVLLVLRDHGSMDQSALGALTAIDRSTLTPLLDRLEARELVTKEADPANRRRRIITLTEAGRRHLKAAVAEAARLHERLQLLFGEEELRRLVDALRTLGDMPPEATDEP